MSVRSINGAKRDPWLTILTSSLLLGLYPAQALFALEPPAEATKPAEHSPDQPGEKSAAEEQHAPELGVFVTATPGNGVLIVDVAPHSPAETSGLESGDFLLSVDGKNVSTPEELRKLIQASKAGAHVKISYWRQGKTIQGEATLAARSTETSEEQHKAWLGVVLEAGDQPGALIELVHPRGSAKKAGLHRGDLIVQIDGQKVTSVADAVAQIENLKPQTSVKIVVRRDDKEETLKVTLGSTKETLGSLPNGALTPFALGNGDGAFDLEEGGFLADEHQQLKGMVQQLRKELDEMRRELSQTPKKGDGEKEQGKKESAEPKKTESSAAPAAAEKPRQAESISAKTQASYLAQYGPYYRYPRYRYAYRRPLPPRVYPYTYYYYRGAPYYYPYPPVYPGRAYYGPGVTVRVGPYFYFQTWR